jgi:hypothetical protein
VSSRRGARRSSPAATDRSARRGRSRARLPPGKIAEADPTASPTVGNRQIGSAKIQTAQTQRPGSMIVEPKRVSHNRYKMVAVDMTEEEHRRAGELADELFRTIMWRAAANKKRD